MKQRKELLSPPDRLRLSGRWFASEEIEQIRETCWELRCLSRLELTQTVCEHLEWRRVNGENKLEACKKALEKLEAMGLVELPEVRSCQRRSSKKERKFSSISDAQSELVGSLSEFSPIRVELVKDKSQQGLWHELVARWHYLGFQQGFGARLYYLIWSEREPEKSLGCLLYAVSAWKVGCRDEWIGWTREDRIARLHLVVNNSRFLIVPWVRVKNLASHALGLSVKRLPDDWQERYGYKPMLLEAFVEADRYMGISYRSMNWKCLGQTVGTSRTYRKGDRLQPRKDVYVYPLDANYRAILKGEVVL